MRLERKRRREGMRERVEAAGEKREQEIVRDSDTEPWKRQSERVKVGNKGEGGGERPNTFRVFTQYSPKTCVELYSAC